MKERSLPSKKILRRMKFLSDQQGIMNRYLAEGDGWEPHLENTRHFIQECLEESGPENVAVLGSGWLLDIPLDYLAENMKEVFLVDIVHPPQVRKKAEKYPALKLVEADLTGGGIQGAWDLVSRQRKTGRGSILDIAFQASLAGVKAEYYISLNILNQLDILILEFMESNMNIPDDEKDRFRSRIQQQHLYLLPKGRSCLITDTEERNFSRDGEQVSSKPLVYTAMPSARNHKTWMWEFDGRGEYRKGCITRMKVEAFKF